MAKYTFICEYDDKTKVTYETTEYNLYELLADIEQFLRGTGFTLPGTLTFESERESFDDWSNNNHCDVCGFEKNVMRCHDCGDINCPKESW